MDNNKEKEVVETIKAAKTYLSHLQELFDKIQDAGQQIQDTSRDTQKTIESTFADLLAHLSHELHVRRDELIKHTNQMREQSLAPLEACKVDICNKIDSCHKLIAQGNGLLAGTTDNFKEFSEKSSTLGSLPEIPDLKEVPYISFQYEPPVESQLLDLCTRVGQVFRIAPVQISETYERPGAILVEWNTEDNDERGVDIQLFRLQRAFGDVINEPHLIGNFSDCFIGLETQFVIKELQVNQTYSFRVCCKFEGSDKWSPWSLPSVALTTIKSYSWKENKDYILANENKIATPCKASPSLLVSDGAQFAVGHTIEFTYLEYDKKCSTVALITTKDPATIKSGSHFAVDSTGEICVDGVKKSTKLPEVSKGSKLCFSCEPAPNSKVRIHIDSSDKRVTYDWHITESTPLFFAAHLHSTGSKIMVE